jgi:hypothetical protein
MSFLHQVFRFMYPLLKILHASHQPHRFLHTDELTASEMMRLPAPAHARPRDILPLVIARGLCWQWHDELQQHWAHQVLSRFSTAGCTVAVNQLNRCPNIFFEENRCPNINEVCWKTKFAQWYGQLICLPEIRIISISFLPMYYNMASQSTDTFMSQIQKSKACRAFGCFNLHLGCATFFFILPLVTNLEKQNERMFAS